MDVLVIDYMGTSEEWLHGFCKEEVNVIHTITPIEQHWIEYLDKCEYDAIFIFESGKREFFAAMKELFNIHDERIVYVSDINSWITHRWAAYAFLKEDSYLFRAVDCAFEKNKRYYSVCTVEDLSYVGYSTDDIIMPEMYRSRENWSKIDMVIFNGLATNFYDLSGRKYFLDLGANIGTTSIYFKKKIDSDIKVLAFEPDPETYKLLCANFILNEMPEDSILENCGLADKEEDMVLHRSPNNPGGNSLVVEHHDSDVSVHVVTLDDYLDSKNINLGEIKYIWIDTEGFEAQLFGGMKKLISSQNIPIFMEWNPSCYVYADIFDEFVNMITNNFSGYIDIGEVKGGNAVIHKSSDLWKTKDCVMQTDIFLIK